MDKIDIAGVNTDAISKQELLEEIERRAKNGQKTWLTTLYSEFLHAALRDETVLAMLNKADIAVADGIGIMWAAKFLSIPLTANGYWTKIMQALWQAVYTGAMIILAPKKIRSVIPEKIVGADLVWDLSKLAADNGWSVYLLGGFDDTPELAAKKLQATSYKLRAAWSNKNPDDSSIINDIKKASPDFLFVAYGPLKQESWIAQNLTNLPVKLAIGLGGTFDYIAGKKPNPPHFLRYGGFEWLYRLFTQPKRIKRIFNATFGLVIALIKYKVFSSLPFRQNAVSVVLNEHNEVFIARFNPGKRITKALGYDPREFTDYWQLPQGGIEKGETLEEGARRELWEETAMRRLDFIKVSNRRYSYLWKNPAQRPLLIRKRFQYKGQQQHVIYFRFKGPEKEVVLDWDEFVEYKWVPWQDLEKELHQEKIPLAKIALDDLRQIPSLINPA